MYIQSLQAENRTRRAPPLMTPDCRLIRQAPQDQKIIVLLCLVKAYKLKTKIAESLKSKQRNQFIVENCLAALALACRGYVC